MHGVPRNRMVTFGTLTALCVVTDLWSKDAVFSRFGLNAGTDWILDGWVRFRLHTSLNFGALWGMGQGLSSVFALLSVAAFVGIIYWLFIRGAAHSLWLTVSLAFVAGGSLGNLYDRLGVMIPGEAELVCGCARFPALSVRRYGERSVARLGHLQRRRHVPGDGSHHADDPVVPDSASRIRRRTGGCRRVKITQAGACPPFGTRERLPLPL
ncbi:MAG: signal peptidase II [Planctomycetaceae bacterium]